MEVLGIMAESESKSMPVPHQLHPQQSDLTNVKALLRRDPYWTRYVRHSLHKTARYLSFSFQMSDLLEQWSCGSLETTRVFTDQWPDCTCVLLFHHFESPGSGLSSQCLL